jgi:hypothetical protein
MLRSTAALQHICSSRGTACRAPTTTRPLFARLASEVFLSSLQLGFEWKTGVMGWNWHSNTPSVQLFF